jgi:hypothetical protein
MMSKAILSLAACAALALAQDPQGGGGWRRIGDSSQAANAPSNAPPVPAPPSTLTIAPGTLVTVRLNQALSSDHSQQGDAFTATLEQPVVANGIVVAHRGEMLEGRVSQAQKARHGENLSKLGIELTDLTLADGTPVPIQSELIVRNGQGWNGHDTGAIVGTGAVGAAIGAIAGGGTGAAIGAGAGGVAGLIGVLATHGHPTVLTPESLLTFRINSAVTISTDRAPQAFRPAEPADYAQNTQPRLVRRGPGYPPYPYYGSPYYGYGNPYPYWGYPGVVIGVRGGFRRW